MDDAQQRILQIEHQLSTHDRRLTNIERLVGESTTDRAVRMERDKHMDKRFDKIESDVGDVKGYLLRIVWVIVFGIISTVLTFVFRGGTNVIPPL